MCMLTFDYPQTYAVTGSAEEQVAQLRAYIWQLVDMLNQAEQILLDEAAFVPTLYSTTHYLIADYVTGVEFYFLSPQMDWTYADITK